MKKNNTLHNQVVRMGIDISKHYFQFHGIETFGKVVLQKKVKREHFLMTLAQIKPCKIGIEACGAAHHWARNITKLGHDVVLIPAQHVKPYVLNNKNDARDAEGICEAMNRPSIHPVPIKTIEQQDVQMAHRIREQLVSNRTAQSNQIRGLLGEYGIVFKKGISYTRKLLPLLLEDADNSLSSIAREMFSGLYEQFCIYDEKVAAIEHLLESFTQTNVICQKLKQVDGIGTIGSTALYGAIGNGSHFKNGRAMAACFGLVPRQHSTGGKEVLLSITKKGNRYVRTMITHGARALVSHCDKNKDDPLNMWLLNLIHRRGKQRAIIAMANKLMRIAWAVLNKDIPYSRSKCCLSMGVV